MEREQEIEKLAQVIRPFIGDMTKFDSLEDAAKAILDAGYRLVQPSNDLTLLPVLSQAEPISEGELISDEEIAYVLFDAGERQYKGKNVTVTTIDIYPALERQLAHDNARFAAEREKESPKIVCLCGSTRFKDAFFSEYARLSDAGNIVLSVSRLIPDHRADNAWDFPEQEKVWHTLHFRKIDLAELSC